MTKNFKISKASSEVIKKINHLMKGGDGDNFFKNESYNDLAAVTDHKDYQQCVDRFTKDKVQLLHYIVGMSTESNEALDMLKKHFFYGKEFDKTNLIEELGDAMWYISRACDLLDVSIEKIQEINIKKLKSRFGDKFSQRNALNRNLKTERSILDRLTKEAK